MQLRLEAAYLLFDQGLHGESITRAYFAVFSACKALLTSQGILVKTHKGVHRELYRSHGDQVDTAFCTILWQERRAYDYQLHIPSREHTARRLEETRRFIKTISML